ncbi:MAG: ABC transporter ATP-binding protein [Myxococcales bacterium]|nr:MAG: ABC transporter ATP-binding protein [Myxococcales bacterium]
MRERIRQAFGHIPPTLALVLRSSPGKLGGYVVLALLGAAVPLGVAYGSKRLIDAVAARDGATALRWSVIEGGLVALLAFGQRGQALLRGLMGSRLGVDINRRIIEKAIELPLQRFEDPEFYDRMTKARREASSRPIGVVGDAFQIGQNALALLGYAGLLLGLGPWALGGLFLASIPATVAEARFSAQQFRLRSWRAPETRRLNYLEYVLTNDAHAKEVKLFGLGPTLLTRWTALGDQIVREDASLATRRALWGYALSLLSTAAFYGCYAYLAAQAVRGQLTLGDLAMYAAAFRQGQQAFQGVLGALGGIYEDNLYMSNLFDFLALPAGDAASASAAAATSGAASPASPPAPLQLRGEGSATSEEAPAVGSSALPLSTELERGPGGEADTTAGIRFEGVGFRYPGQERWAVRGIDLTIAPGESVALVGQNGSGKTTLIKLLTRLYEPTEGRVVLDGRDLRDWSGEELRRRIGVIFQDFNRYQFTLQENVGVGQIERQDDETGVQAALVQAGADEIAAGLDQGLATPLGRWFHGRGVELSGGQWQRVALARAYLREQADILVLDEPTAALDAEAEAAVFARFQELTAGRTTLLISHRMSTVRGADRIVVLESGRITEQGTHASLMTLDGRYARLFKLQAQGYL